MYLIPLSPIPNQNLMVSFEDQDISIHLYQRGKFLYMDIGYGDENLRNGAICLPGLEIGGEMYPFSGALIFVDEYSDPQKQCPPNYRELGTRFNLYYCSMEEMLETLHEYMDIINGNINGN